MKLLVLGASGIVGRRVCREVARLEGLESVVIAGRDGALLDRLVSALGHELFSSTTLDLHDSAALRAAMEEVDVVASAAGPAYALERDAVQAAIATGTNYVSLADDLPATEEVTALDEGATRAGVTVVSGCGMSPGLSNLLVALAAREGEPEEVAISLAASSADDTGPATAMHFLKMLDDPAPALSDGVDEVARGGTGPRLVYFPEPIGWVETFRSGHPEVLTLPTRYPTLRTLTFRIGLTEKAVMDVVRVSLAAGILSSEGLRKAWLRFSEPARPALEAIPPRGAPWTGLRVDVRMRGATHPVSFAAVDRIANLAALPLIAAIERLPDAAAGVKTPEDAFDAAELLARVAQLGARIARLEPERL